MFSDDLQSSDIIFEMSWGCLRQAFLRQTVMIPLTCLKTIDSLQKINRKIL